jgi:AraC family transcriptional regulator, transcriptional activator of pobA
MKLIKFKRPDGRKINFEIVKLPPQDLKPHEAIARHRHEYYSILFVINGTSKQEIDFDEYTIKKSQLVFIPKGGIHRDIESKKFESYMLLFKDDFLAKNMMEMVNSFVRYAIFQRKLVLDLTTSQHEEFLKLAAVIEQEQNQEEHQNLIFILQNLLLVWLNKMESIAQHLISKNSFINNGALFQKFVTLLDENFLQHKDVAFYCKELNCTAKKLSQTLTEITGKSTNDIIIDTILLEAKRNLCYTSLSIKEIAHELGYDNQFYFSRIFKTKEKVSPEEFRKQFAL